MTIFFKTPAMALLTLATTLLFASSVAHDTCSTKMAEGLPSTIARTKHVRLFPSVLKKGETIKIADRVDSCRQLGVLGKHNSHRQVGEVEVDTDIIKRMMRNVADEEREFPLGAPTLRTTLITASTRPHLDHKATDGSLADEQVVFAFLNDNENAYFNIGDVTVPVVAGDMVSFNGNTVHNTVVESGTVRLLGPFTVRDLISVGTSYCEENGDVDYVVTVPSGGTVTEQCCPESQTIPANLNLVDFPQSACGYDNDCCDDGRCSRSEGEDPGRCVFPPRPPSGADGDPHILTWGHEWFDFMGVCDLILVHAPSFAKHLGLSVHLRTKARYLYSFIESSVLKIGEEDTLEVGAYGQYFLNGVSNAEMPSSIAGYPITYELKSKDYHVFTVDMGLHGTVILKAYKDLVGVKFMNAKEADFGDCVGLMGSFGNGTHLARDGSTVMDDDNAFGQEWQVQEDEAQLFMTKASDTGNCVLPTPKTDTSRKLGETVSHEDAEIACAHVIEGHDQCIYDVIATGDLGAAQTGVF